MLASIGLSIARATSSASSSLTIILVFFDDLDYIIARHAMSVFNNDAPCPYWLPSLFDNDLRPGAGRPRAPTNFAYFGAAA